MSLLDIMEGRDVTPPASSTWEPHTLSNGCIRREMWVRQKGSDRIGFVLTDVVTATGRVNVCWQPGDSTWVHHTELEPSPAPEIHRHEWRPGLHVWPGETEERMVWFCAGCPEIRGRA